MRRPLLLLGAALALGLSVVVFGPQAVPAQEVEVPIQDGDEESWIAIKPLPDRGYTYEEARAAGLNPVNLPEETGLPACPVKPAFDPGHKTEEEAEAALRAAEDAPKCAVPPEATTYGFGLVQPHADYHHTGHQSTAAFGDSLRARLEVPNPAVPLTTPSTTEFMGARALGKYTGVWTEAGWVEHSFLSRPQSPTPCPYGFSVPTQQWHVYCGIELAVGSTYHWKIEHVGCAGAGPGPAPVRRRVVRA
jgi:hypothetical protein